MVTVIAGRNATCKSTILAMLGQPFGLKTEKDIFGNPLRTEFSEIFRVSSQNDKPGDHEYSVGLLKPMGPYELEAPVKSFERTNAKSHLRFVVGKKREKGYGNIDIPVTYLGLRRLFPIGETHGLTITPSTLSDNENKWFTKWYRKIMALSQIENIDLLDSRREKQTLAVTERAYDSTAISSGQDNLGRILGAIISFHRLRFKLRNAYKGGLLLIDEVDAAMHSASQNRLVDLFYETAEKLKLQIIVTTHSRDFINVVTSHHKATEKDTSLLYFFRDSGKVSLVVNPTKDFMDRDLQLLLSPRPVKAKIPKIRLYSEDPEARLFLKSIAFKGIYSRLSIIKKSFGKDDLKTLAQLSDRIEELQAAIFLLDGDCATQSDYHPSVILLPGNGISPENLLYNFLDSLPEDHDFWKNGNGYSKDHFNDRIPTDRGRASMKLWFNKSMREFCWGKDAQLLFGVWAKLNKQTVIDFNKKLLNAANYVAKKKKIPLIENVNIEDCIDPNML